MRDMGWFRRRHFLVDRFQYKLLLVHVGYFFAVVLVFAAIIFAPAIAKLRNETLSWEQKQEAANQFLSLHSHLWPAVFVLLVLLIVHSVLLSHRIAGPLYRFRQVFGSITEGDFSVRAIIRKRDYLSREAAVIDEMVDSLGERFRRVGKLSTELRSSFNELKSSIPTGVDETGGEAVARFEDNLTQLERYLDSIKTSSKRQSPDLVGGSEEPQTVGPLKSQPVEKV
jgi:methyl-accepting chemotaxis protein